ncbi:hypothetical protein [Terrabacter sp. 2YAF2]|uniref:hypothetical protein n=1 Tax=Terrabacter sp. 2YAF2 TaxID=3233026 RepID=UPI003F98821A
MSADADVSPDVSPDVDPDVDRVAVAARRDRLVVTACLSLAFLQTLPYVVVGWITAGGTAAGDGALHALSPAALLGVVAFGRVLVRALAQPSLRPTARGCAPSGASGFEPSRTPVLPGRQARPWLRRLRWAVGAALAGAAVQATAVLLDDAGRSGAEALGRSLDDGSALWAYMLLLVQVLAQDPRAFVAVVLAMVALARARRPVRLPRSHPTRRDHPPPPGARTTRRSPAPPPS